MNVFHAIMTPTLAQIEQVCTGSGLVIVIEVNKVWFKRHQLPLPCFTVGAKPATACWNHAVDADLSELQSGNLDRLVRYQLSLFVCVLSDPSLFSFCFGIQRRQPALTDAAFSLFHRVVKVLSLFFFCCLLFSLDKNFTNTHTPTGLPVWRLKGWLKVMVVATEMAGWAQRKSSQGITSSEWGLCSLQHAPYPPSQILSLWPSPSLSVYLQLDPVRPHRDLGLFHFHFASHYGFCVVTLESSPLFLLTWAVRILVGLPVSQNRGLHHGGSCCNRGVCSYDPNRLENNLCSFFYVLWYIFPH